MIHIGPYKLDNPVALAPMAGVTDLPFRRLCKRLGAGLVVSEMLSSDQRLWSTRKSSLRRVHSSEGEPRSVQIVGNDPTMMAKAGIEQLPGTWDELRSACGKMQGRGIYGAPLPYARNSMTSLVIIGFIHQAGGQVFTPDLDVALVSDEAEAALEFYKSMREFCPVGATGYSWGESLTAFVSGATATGLYSGRVLINVTRQNPRIADHITCTTYPRISTDVEPWTYNDYPSVFIPVDAPEKELTRKFAAWLFKTDGYIRQVHATPGHVLPVIESVARDSRYLDSPVIRRYESEV